MTWDVEYADEFGRWRDSLTETEQESVDASVRLLEKELESEARKHGKTV